MAANQVQDQRSDMEAMAFHHAKRAQLVRAALVGANDGLLSMTSKMMADGAAKMDGKTIILAGVAGLVGGAGIVAIGELVSGYLLRDIKMVQLKREGRTENMGDEELEAEMKKLPIPWQEAGVSALSFAVGAFVPLLGAAFFKDYGVRVGVVIGVVSCALFGFGGLCALLCKAPVVKSSLRMLVGGWLAMGLLFGLTKLVAGSTGL
jgi:VIT1/CCC1 family predicted Fe2+/Mn2+ transporter